MKMNKTYSILLSIFFVEVFILSSLKEINIKAQSWIGNAIGTLVFLLPIQSMLYLLSKDETRSRNIRVCSKLGFWFIIICYVLGGIVTLVKT